MNIFSALLPFEPEVGWYTTGYLTKREGGGLTIVLGYFVNGMNIS